MRPPPSVPPPPPLPPQPPPVFMGSDTLPAAVPLGHAEYAHMPSAVPETCHASVAMTSLTATLHAAPVAGHKQSTQMSQVVCSTQHLTTPVQGGYDAAYSAHLHAQLLAEMKQSHVYMAPSASANVRATAAPAGTLTGPHGGAVAGPQVEAGLPRNQEGTSESHVSSGRDSVEGRGPSAAGFAHGYVRPVPAVTPCATDTLSVKAPAAEVQSSVARSGAKVAVKGKAGGATVTKTRAHIPQKSNYKVGSYLILTNTLLGVGSFGKVKKAVQEKTQSVYACKIIEKELVRARVLSAQVRKEIEIMRRLQHPNIVRLYDVHSTERRIFIFMEMITGGELFDEIVANRRLDECSSRFYFTQLVRGLIHCHELGIYHRDLKPENLLLDENKQLKISDFGLSNFRDIAGLGNSSLSLMSSNAGMLHTQCGTPNYVAPEIITLDKRGYSGAKVDAWSCGIILYVLNAGALPFDANEMDVLFKRILTCDITYPSYFSAPLIDLISQLLKTDPSVRCRLYDAMNHPWMTMSYDELAALCGIDLASIPVAQQLAAESSTTASRPVNQTGTRMAASALPVDASRVPAQGAGLRKTTTADSLDFGERLRGAAGTSVTSITELSSSMVAVRDIPAGVPSAADDEPAAGALEPQVTAADVGFGPTGEPSAKADACADRPEDNPSCMGAADQAGRNVNASEDRHIVSKFDHENGRIFCARLSDVPDIHSPCSGPSYLYIEEARGRALRRRRVSGRSVSAPAVVFGGPTSKLPDGNAIGNASHESVSSNASPPDGVHPCKSSMRRRLRRELWKNAARDWRVLQSSRAGDNPYVDKRTDFFMRPLHPRRTMLKSHSTAVMYTTGRDEGAVVGHTRASEAIKDGLCIADFARGTPGASDGAAGSGADLCRQIVPSSDVGAASEHDTGIGITHGVELGSGLIDSRNLLPAARNDTNGNDATDSLAARVVSDLGPPQRWPGKAHSHDGSILVHPVRRSGGFSPLQGTADPADLRSRSNSPIPDRLDGGRETGDGVERSEPASSTVVDVTWVRSDSDKMVWCRLMKDFDLIPDDVEFGVDSAALNDMWQQKLSDTKERVLTKASFYEARFGKTTFAQGRVASALSASSKAAHVESEADAFGYPIAHDDTAGLLLPVSGASPEGTVERHSVRGPVRTGAPRIGNAEIQPLAPSPVAAPPITPQIQQQQRRQAEAGRAARAAADEAFSAAQAAAHATAAAGAAAQKAMAAADAVSAGYDSSDVLFVPGTQRVGTFLKPVANLLPVPHRQAHATQAPSGIAESPWLSPLSEQVASARRQALPVTRGRQYHQARVGGVVDPTITDGCSTPESADQTWHGLSPPPALPPSLNSSRVAQYAESSAGSTPSGRFLPSSSREVSPAPRLSVASEASYTETDEEREWAGGGTHLRTRHVVPEPCVTDTSAVDRLAAKGDAEGADVPSAHVITTRSELHACPPVARGALESRAGNVAEGTTRESQVSPLALSSMTVPTRVECKTAGERPHSGESPVALPARGKHMTHDGLLRIPDARAAALDNSVKLEDPFTIEIPGPSSGPIKPPPKPKFMSALPSTGANARKRFAAPLSPKRYTQFHSLREPKWCFGAVEKVLKAYGCSQVHGKQTTSTGDCFRLKCVVVKDGQSIVASVDIFRVDSDLCAILFKKRSSVDSKRFITFYEEVYRMFCSYESRGVIDAPGGVTRNSVGAAGSSTDEREHDGMIAPVGACEDRPSSDGSTDAAREFSVRACSRPRVLPPHFRRMLKRLSDDTSASSA